MWTIYIFGLHAEERKYLHIRNTVSPKTCLVFSRRGLTDESEILKFLQHGTLVGLLPVPHPILIRKYQANAGTAMWFRTYMWGVVYLRWVRQKSYLFWKLNIFSHSLKPVYSFVFLATWILLSGMILMSTFLRSSGCRLQSLTLKRRLFLLQSSFFLQYLLYLTVFCFPSNHNAWSLYHPFE